MAKTAAELKAYNAARYAANNEAVKARVRAYAAENADAVRARQKAYRAANADVLQARSRNYYQSHRSERLAYQKSLHASKPDKVKAYKKEWWAKNREAFAAERKSPEGRARIRNQFKNWYDATYHAKHREKFLARNAKRRALKRTTLIGPIDFAQVLRESRGLCGICEKPLDLFGIDFDHIVPLARGGSHTQENLQATHSRCNRSKGARVG